MWGRKHFNIVTALMFVTCWFQTVSAQNLNTPNRTGPMGIEVNTYSGNTFITRNDDYITSRGIDIDLTFYYNSFDFNKNVGFGNGWSCLYSARYKTDSLNNMIIKWGDGREDLYKPNGANFTPPTGIFSVLSQYQANKFLVTQTNGIKMYFDNNVHRKLSKIEEPNGNSLTLNYTDSLLTSITTNAGQSISLAYNANGNLQTVTDAVTSPSRAITYQYDAAGNLVRVTDPLGAKIKYAYLVNGPVKSMIDENSNTVDIIYYGDFTCSELIGCNKRQSFSYDTTQHTTTCTDYLSSGNNQVSKYTYQKTGTVAWLSALTSNCCGFNMSFTYDQQGNKISETDANGNITEYTYDNKGNVLTTTDALGNIDHYTYSSDFSKILSYTDERGFTTNMVYDARGNLTQLTEPGNLNYNATYAANGDILTSTDPKGNVFVYSYDNYGNPASVSGPNGYHASMGYDARGNLVSYTDAQGKKDSLEFDILSRLKKATDPLAHTVNYSYDSIGNVTSFVNENNQPSSFQYDASNRPVVLTDALGNKTTVEFDAMDNITSMKDALGNVNRFAYDSRNRISALTDALGNVYSLNYDPNGNFTTLNLPNGQVIHYTYDALDRVKTINDNIGNLRSYNYDPSGYITSMSSGTGGTINIQYDNKNRVTQITDRLGNSMHLGYDNNNNVVSVTDRNNLNRTITYDSLNRIKTYIDNPGNSITFIYDNLGNVVSVTDQNNHSTSYTYDSLERVKRITYPDNRFMDFTYDNIGNIVSKKTPDGSVINYSYDNLSRIISKTLPGGNTFTYTYDSLSRIRTATNNSGTVSFTYDALSRLSSETFNSRTVSYSYSVAGRTQTIDYPDGTIVTYSFDSRNRLTSISRNNVPLVTSQYDLNNNMTQKTFANGIITTAQYDASDRLIAYSTGNGGNIQNTTLTYDNEHNKTALIRQNDSNKSEHYNYDNSYRLIDYKKGPAGSPVLHNTYSYDALGNRTAANLNGTNTSYTINNLNQVTGSSGGININYVYDNNGNLTYDGHYYKSYDAEGHLLKDSSAPSSVITYLYDAFGRHVQRSLNGNPLNYTFSGLSPIEERDGTGNLKNKTYFGGFLSPVANENNGTSYYYHNNELNSVEAITNVNGNAVEKYEYDVYGKTSIYDSAGNLLAGSQIGNRIGYTGQQFDSVTGNTRFYFREYNPETGTFNQRDLIGYGDGMGMYQYVHNNPANGIDILGLDDCLQEQSTFNKTKTTIETTESWLSFINSPGYLYFQTYKTHFDYLERTGEKLAALDLDKGAEFAGKNLDKIGRLSDKVEKLRNFGKNVGNISNGLTGLDVVIKTINFGQAAYSGDGMATVKAGGNLGQSALGFTPVGTAYNFADFLQTQVTGKSMNDWSEEYGQTYGQRAANEGVLDVMGESVGLKKIEALPDEEEEQAEFHRKNGTFEKWWKIRRKQNLETALRRRGMVPKPNCPQNKNPNGTNQPPPGFVGPVKGTEIVQAHDPNAIIGPDGQPNLHWVSVHDRLPYTILFENSAAATAPAKFIRISSPVETKQDAASFQLSSFGFNNQTFNVPTATAAYYQRLDCRDSLGLYVDITAGYDVVNNKFFWEFQSIDPVTLLPPADPLKGFLVLQDSTKPNYGHGFVNFSIKPQQSAVTLDTISAHADIVFDSNDTIPTNRHKNTIDAFAPTTHMGSLPGNSVNSAHLTWSGADDTHGCGLKYYTLYVSTDGTNFNILKSGITRTDTTFYGADATTYYLFVLGTDSVGNTETLRGGEVKSTFFSVSLPVTWLYFKGTNLGKDNLLEWATGSEQNSREFIIERSLDGINFSSIGTKAAAGNTTSTTNYDYKDYNVDRLGVNVMFYRLKQVDIDGHFKYSNIVRLSVNVKTIQNSIVYPNPTSGMITLVIGDKNLIGTDAMLFDESGRMLERVKISANAQSFNLSRYLNGVYFIKLVNKEVLRIVKQ